MNDGLQEDDSTLFTFKWHVDEIVQLTHDHPLFSFSARLRI